MSTADTPQTMNQALFVRISAEDKNDFYAACKTAGVEPSDAVRRLVAEFTEGNIKIQTQVTYSPEN